MLARRIPLVALALFALAADWPQFRGPNAVGVAEGAKLPEKIGVDKNVIWKIDLPPGHSSPIVAADQTMSPPYAIRKSWSRSPSMPPTAKCFGDGEAYTKLEKIHTIGSYAQPSPVSDGEIVLSFFGSSGLYCYDKYGELLWSHPFGPFPNDFVPVRRH